MGLAPPSRDWVWRVQTELSGSLGHFPAGLDSEGALSYPARSPGHPSQNETAGQELAMKKVKGLAHRKRGKKSAHARAKRKAKLRRARQRQTSGERSTYR